MPQFPLLHTEGGTQLGFRELEVMGKGGKPSSPGSAAPARGQEDVMFGGSPDSAQCPSVPAEPHPGRGTSSEWRPPSPDGIPGALPSQAVPAAPGDTGHPNPLCRQHVLCFACGIFPPLSSFCIISLLFQERYSSGAGRGIRCSRVCLRCSPCSSRRCSPARGRCLSEPSRCRPGITHGVRLEEGGGRPRSLLCLQLFVSHPLIDIFFPPPLFLLLPTFSVPAP